MKKSLLYLIILFLLVFLGIRALFHPGFYTSHDGHHQLIRLMHFDRGLRDGQFPVRWAGKAMAGYGYPLFIFTYRLPFWIGEFWRLLGNSLVDSIKFSFIVGYCLSGLAIFLFLKNLTKNKTAAFLGTAAYLWAPYRFSDLYVRASLGESYCFIFLPLIFWAFFELRKNFSKKFFILGAFSSAFLLLSHGLMFFLTLPFIGCWWLYLLLKDKKKRSCFLRSSFWLLVLASGLSCYYWLPALYEKKFIIFSQVLSKMFFQHFPSLKQLLYSPWGYGFSIKGINDGMSFQVGLSFWFVFLAAILITLYQLIKKRRIKLKLLFFLSSFVLALFLMLPYSVFLWKWVMKFLVVDFPWRYLLMTTFLGAVMTGLVYKNLKWKLIRLLFLAACLFLVVYGNRNHLKVNLYVDYPDGVLMKSVDTSNSYDDYKPIWINNQQVSLDDPLFSSPEKKTKFYLLKENSYQLNFRAKVRASQAEVFLRKTWYPGWKSLIDGRKTKVSNCGGRICFRLPAGDYLINLWFGETKLRLLADCISLISLIEVISWLFYSKIRRNENTT